MKARISIVFLICHSSGLTQASLILSNQKPGAHSVIYLSKRLGLSEIFVPHAEICPLDTFRLSVLG